MVLRISINNDKPPVKVELDIFYKWVANRIKKNKNCIIVVNGGTGEGKSLGCLELARKCRLYFPNTNFSIDDNLSFKFRDLLIKMQKPINQKAGTVFIMEEVGVFGSGASSREWQSQANKFFFSFLQTARHRNQILILNCPSFSYLEKGARELCHAQLEAINIDHAKKLSFFKPFQIQVNRREGKPYFKYIRYKVDGVRKRLSTISFALPPKDIVDRYEKEKLKFTTALNQSIIDGDDKKVKPKLNKVDTNKRREIILSLTKAGKSTREIGELIGITQRSVSRHISQSNTPICTTEELTT